MGTRSFIFLSGKLLYFFLGLYDYSDKFPKMFAVRAVWKALQTQISESNDCERRDDFAGNCIREWDVWRLGFCLIFSLILRK